MKCAVCDKRVSASRSIIYINRQSLRKVRTHFDSDCEYEADRDTRFVKENK